MNSENRVIMKDQKIKSVAIVNQQGSSSFYWVGDDGVTDIRIGNRQISCDMFITVIEVWNKDQLIEEISMSTPYVLTYYNEEQ